MTARISRDRYDRLRAHGYAGTADELIADSAWCHTGYWQLANENGATVLRPVEVGPAPQPWACCISSIGPACGHLTDSIDRHPAGRAISKEQQP